MLDLLSYFACVCVWSECPFQNLNQIKFTKKKDRKETRKYFHISFNEHSKKRRGEKEEKSGRVVEWERGSGRYKRIASALCFVVMAACGQNA